MSACRSNILMIKIKTLFIYNFTADFLSDVSIYLYIIFNDNLLERNNKKHYETNAQDLKTKLTNWLYKITI